MKKKFERKVKYQFETLSKWTFILIISASLMWGSCSILGLAIGSASDHSHHKSTTVAGWQISEVELDQDLSLLLKDFNLIEGKYKGMHSIQDEEYNRNYQLQKDSLHSQIKLPSLGDTILITLQNNNYQIPAKSYKYLFAGFDLSNLLIRSGTNTRTGQAPLSKIDKIADQQGNEIEGYKLIGLVQSYQIPVKTEIMIECKDSIKMINPADVIQLSTKPKKSYAALTGFLIGAGIDAAILAIATSSSSTKTTYTPPPTTGGKAWGGSCPYVYSYDGHDYILDSETFGGAIFKAAQRTDLDNLDFLKETNGTYQLKLTNELEETQYIDEFKLIVVDHALHTKVIPDFNGKLHVLSNLQTPVKAIDKNGNDVLSLVKNTDEKIWISNPFIRNSEKKGDGRDAMILEFEKPKQATHVQLAFNLQNTIWAAHMQEIMLSLHGNKLNQWYDLINNSTALQSAFKQIMIREGMLLIQLWDGKAWKTHNYVWEVGPSIAKDQVVDLDLNCYAEQNLRIRLESTVGFWMINSVNADYSEEGPIQIHELSPEKAFDHLGNDLLETLKCTDQQYYAMPSKQDRAEISFKAIPLQENSLRSFILKCNGYYTIHADDTGEPQQELLNKLIAEPGAYGQYTLRVLNQNFANACNLQNLK